MLAVIVASEAGNHVILPADINEVIWGSIAFLVVMTVLVWKGGPGIKNMWNGRIERIAKEIEDAESSRTQAEAELADVQGRIANADQERQRIRAEAARTAAALKEQVASRTGAELVEIKSRAAADTESSRAQAAADLQSDIAALALGAAEQVVARNLDASTQNELIESYIAKVGGA